MNDFPPSLIGQQTVIGALAKAVSGKVAYGHAYLLSGADRQAVAALAAWFASYIVCSAPKDTLPCGACAGCVSRAHGEGLWLHHIEQSTDESSHSVERIRSIRHFVHLRPVGRGRRVVLVESADALRGAAANALLKNLEEPSEDLTYILTAQHAHAVLPTIRSRTMCVSVQPVPHAVLEKALIAKGFSQSAARFATKLYPGQAGEVVRLLEDTHRYEEMHTLERTLGNWSTMPVAQRMALTAEILKSATDSTGQRQRVVDALHVLAQHEGSQPGRIRALLQACSTLRTNAQPKYIFDAFALQTI